MDIGARVWIACSEQIWRAGVIEEVQGEVVLVRCEDDASCVEINMNQRIGMDDSVIHLRNDLDDFIHVPNLIQLQYLHEPELLYAVSNRFENDLIYTYIGDILLSFNPFRPIDIYTNKHVREYEAASMDSDAPPHVFAIASMAYKSMRDEKLNQSILVSGESGAGKTENTKFLMQYLATVGAMEPGATTTPTRASKSRSRKAAPVVTTTTTDIQTQILQTNPILEAFGNAKTVRNDNSSRFGKFIALQFGSHHKIVGAKISVYLLEKIRVSHQSVGERNFHIFYELCAGADDDMAEAFNLLDMEDFTLLNQSQCYERRSVDDATQFTQTMQAFRDMGIPQEEQTTVLGIVASLLHLGNVEFDAVISSTSNLEGASVNKDKQHHLHVASKLLGVSPEALVKALVTRRIHTTREVVELKLTTTQAEDAKQSLMQSIYGGLFLYLVERLSSIICSPCEQTIGILDIFGFENLHTNGFEQLCINYANERLQAQFNDLVFAKEQRMYEREGIEWKYIEYPDNAPCLQLLEDRPHGLWSLLDEECILPKGSNEGWISKLYQTYIPFEETVSESRRHSNPERGQIKRPSGTKLVRPFYATYGQQVEYQFVIGHFAGKVMYEMDAFLQKNQDALPVEAIALCNDSTSAIVQSLLPNTMKSTNKSVVKGTGNAPRLTRVSSLRAASVSSQFRTQLDELIQVIGNTQARYIRCIKSNDNAQPRLLSKPRAVQQLRSGGVLEAVRIARAGYAVRVDHVNFIEQFSFLLPSLSDGSPSAKKKKSVIAALSAKQHCERIAAAILLKLQLPETDLLAKSILCCAKFQRTELQDACGRAGFQLGHSKVFFRKELYNELRRLRSLKLKSCATDIQRVWRGFIDRIHYKSALEAILMLQNWIRTALAIKRQRFRCAKVIQACWLRFSTQRKYHRAKYQVIVLQRLWRSRRLCREARVKCAAIRSQREAEARQTLMKEKEAILHSEELHLREVAVHPKSETKVLSSSQKCQTSSSEPHYLPERYEAEAVHHVADTANAALVENLTLQNEKLRLELELLRQQSALQMQMSFAASRPVEYHQPTSPVAPPLNELEFAHQQIVALSQQLLTTQIKYSNLLMDYNENLSGYDADRPSLSDEAFSMVDDLAVPCPESLECAQEQLRTLLRKLHIAKEKLKNLETEMTRSTKPRCESIEGLEFFPRKSYEWRPHFYSHAEEYDYDVMSEVGDEYEQRVEEIQRQVDGLRSCISQRKSLPSLPSTVSTRAPSTTGSSDYYHDYPRRSSLPTLATPPPNNSRRLSYQVQSVNKWARDSECYECKTSFTWFTRRHHCRLCGNSFCHEHSNRRACLSGCGTENESEPVRVCDVCFVEICFEARKHEASSRRESYRPFV